MTLPSHLESYRAAFLAAGQRFRVNPLLLAAICDRESGGGRALVPPGPAGLGDHGHGHGLMQLDNRSWGVWLAHNDWADPAVNISKGAAIFSAGLLRFGSIPAALAAYNAGGSRVAQVLAELTKPTKPDRMVEALDAITTGPRPGAPGNYVSDVLRRLAAFTEASSTA